MKQRIFLLPSDLLLLLSIVNFSSEKSYPEACIEHILKIKTFRYVYVSVEK